MTTADMERMQIMHKNTVKQELDGLKHNISHDLTRAFHDFRSDFSDLTDADKADVYKAICEEIFDVLNYHGIQPEI